jgi:hypothetical protein
MKANTNGSTLPQTTLNTPTQATRFREQATGIGQACSESQKTGAERAARVKSGVRMLQLPGQLKDRPGT